MQKKEKTPGTIKHYKIVKAEGGNDIPKKKITSSAEAVGVIRQFYGDDLEIYESVFILLLNRANITTGWAKISQGGISGSVVDIRIVCKYAIDALASGVIIAHNHPSGALMPSDADNKITKSLAAALKVLEIPLHDHVILTTEGYFSFADEGLI